MIHNDRLTKHNYRKIQRIINIKDERKNNKKINIINVNNNVSSKITISKNPKIYHDTPSIVVYSFCASNILHLPKIYHNEDNVKYIMFTNCTYGLGEEKEGWILLKTQKETTQYSVQDKNKKIKWNPWGILSFTEFDYSIYIDSKIDFIISPNEIINRYKNRLHYGFATLKHSQRDCVYDEITECIKEKRGNIENLINLRDFYVNINFPNHYGLCESSMVLTYLKSETAYHIEKIIYEEYVNRKTYRDQVIIPYILQKNNIDINDISILGGHLSNKIITYNNTNDVHIQQYRKNTIDEYLEELQDLTIISCLYNNVEYYQNFIKSFYQTNKEKRNEFLFIDNSTTEPNINQVQKDGFRCIDNLNNHLFEEEFNNIKMTFGYSCRHCRAIQYLIENVSTKYILLCNNDILFMNDISDIFHDFKESKCIIGGKHELRHTFFKDRIVPFFMFIDLEQLRQYNLKFFDKNRMHEMTIQGNSYDTGASITEDCVKLGKAYYESTYCYNERDLILLQGNTIFDDYFIHLRGGSLSKTQHFIQNSKKKDKEYDTLKKFLNVGLTDKEYFEFNISNEIDRKSIGLGINVFENTDFLEKIIKELKNSVDYIVIGYQDVGYCGNKAPDEIYPYIQGLKDKNLVNDILLCDVKNISSTEMAEMSKRNMISTNIERYGCDYQIIIDSDEIYHKEIFERYKKIVLNNNMDVTYVRGTDYYHDERHYIKNLSHYFNFISKSKYKFSQIKEYAFICDPTRRYNVEFNNITLFPDRVCDHYSYLIDINKKLDYYSQRLIYRYNDNEDIRKNIVDSFNNFTFDTTKAYNCNGGEIDIGKIEELCSD